MEGTWQWEQRKHCHIILLNPLSYVKENPEQTAGESAYIGRFFFSVQPASRIPRGWTHSVDVEKDDSQKNPVSAGSTIMPFYVLGTLNVVVTAANAQETFEKEILCYFSNYRSNTNFRPPLGKALFIHRIVSSLAWPLSWRIFTADHRSNRPIISFACKVRLDWIASRFIFKSSG